MPPTLPFPRGVVGGIALLAAENSMIGSINETMRRNKEGLVDADIK